MEKILGMGNSLVDILLKMEDDTLLEQLNLPKGSMQLIDETVLDKIKKIQSGYNFHRASGGSVANTVCALGNLGAMPGFIGKVGCDDNGMFFRTALEEQGVSACLLSSEHLPTGVASTFISPDGERTFGTYLGASGTLAANDLTLSMFEGYSYFYIEGYLLQSHELMQRALSLAKEAGLQICLDLASYNVVENEKEFFEKMISQYVDIVFANEGEARAYTGMDDPADALMEIASKCSVAIVKIGKDGSIVKKGTEVVKVPPFQVDKVVDTTGAGDFYAAGFLYALTCGYSLEKCARISSVLAGHVIQVLGTDLTKERWNEIKLNIEEILHV